MSIGTAIIKFRIACLFEAKYALHSCLLQKKRIGLSIAEGR